MKRSWEGEGNQARQPGWGTAVKQQGGKSGSTGCERGEKSTNTQPDEINSKQFNIMMGFQNLIVVENRLKMVSGSLCASKPWERIDTI